MTNLNWSRCDLWRRALLPVKAGVCHSGLFFGDFSSGTSLGGRTLLRVDSDPNVWEFTASNGRRADVEPLRAGGCGELSRSDLANRLCVDLTFVLCAL